MVNTSKKAISPVVATALLLVVAVVAVVGFQTWFNTYQSDIVTDVESRSDTGSSITIERLEGTTQPVVYYKNSGSTLVDVTEVKILSSGAEICVNTSAKDASANSVNSTYVDTDGSGGTCTLTNGNTYNVVVVTVSGVYSENEVAR